MPPRTPQHRSGTSQGRLQVLGHFDLSLPDRGLYLPPSVQRLLVYLALHPEGVDRQHAAAVLWPDLPDHRAAASLRSVLWRLSRAHGSHRLVESAERLALAAGVRVDMDEATGLAARLTAPEAVRPPLCVPEVLRLDLLPSWPEEWLVIAREHFHQVRLHTLESASRLLLEQGWPGPAMEYAMTALAADDLRESAHRCVTEIHLWEGNIAAALRTYDAFRHRLRSELAVPPTARYRRLLAPFNSRPLD